MFEVPRESLPLEIFAAFPFKPQSYEKIPETPP